VSQHTPGDREISFADSFSARHRFTAGTPRAEGEGQMKGWKWLGNLRVQLCIIAALIFVIWIVLKKQYY
jgi:hypothetical protein